MDFFGKINTKLKKYTLSQKFYNCNLVANMSQKYTLNASTHQKFTKNHHTLEGPQQGHPVTPFYLYTRVGHTQPDVENQFWVSLLLCNMEF